MGTCSNAPSGWCDDTVCAVKGCKLEHLSSNERCEHSPLYTYDSVGIQYRAPCPWCLQLELTRIVAEGAAVEPVAPSSPPADPDPEPSRADKLRAALEPAGVKVTVLGEAAEPAALPRVLRDILVDLDCCANQIDTSLVDRIKQRIACYRAAEPQSPPRCSLTGNPCGTDTWAVHAPPDCQCGRMYRAGKERAKASQPPPAHPSAWIRGRVTPSGQHGPEECDEEVCPGEDQPPGEGWVALYTYPHPYEKLRASTPPYIALLNLKCRFGCTDPAVVLVEFDDGGCVCWPDRVQALCAQHWQTSEPIKGARAIASLAEPPPTARRIELLNLLEDRERKHDAFRLAEQGGQYAVELTAFDRAHAEVIDWVTDHADELLPLQRPAPPPSDSLLRLADRWEESIQVAYNDYSYGQRCALEQAAQELREAIRAPATKPDDFATWRDRTAAEVANELPAGETSECPHPTDQIQTGIAAPGVSVPPVCMACGDPVRQPVMTVETSAAIRCPRCGGAGVVFSGQYMEGKGGCMLCRGIGKVVQIGPDQYRPAENGEGSRT